ncbi:MAG TPA: MSHA biogenesis protein MshJ [Paucimonas sp.]|nr:MSHA biogenesis protein MshJ [Paucimonas sp.]
MKQYWQRLATRIDALTLRERAVVFAMVALILITLINALLLDPLFAKTKLLSDEIKEHQAKTFDIQQKIHAAVKRQTSDPDAESKLQLQKLEQQAHQMQASLQEVQKGLVSPDKMSGLLESILRRHGNLRLVSLKTLPPANLMDSKETTNNNAAEKTAAPAGKETDAPGSKDKPAAGGSAVSLVYKHGVEIVVQGSYLDMIDYLVELESMPWQLFWGKSVLNAEDHSKTTLTLTLYTLSLNKQWLNI